MSQRQPLLSRGLLRETLALGLLIVAALVLFQPIVFGGRSLHRRDHGEYSIPLFHWMHGRYSHGQDADWAQGMANGEPALDELTTLQYYPPNRLLLTWLDPVSAYNLVFVLHLALAACGLYLLLRAQGRSRQGSLLGALAGGFGGGMFFVLPWYTVIVSMGWIPWIFLGLHLLQHSQGRRRWAGAALLGLATGLAFSGGYVGMVAYAMLPVGLLHLAWLLRGPGKIERWRRSWAPLLFAVVTAALLTVGPLMGLRRLSQESQRGEALSFEASAENSLSPTALIESVAPHAFGRADDDSFLGVSWRFGTYDPDGMLLYLGLGGLLLALAGLRSRPRAHWPLVAAAAVLVLYALGRWTPLYACFIRLPVLSHLRAPAKAAALVGILFAPLVAEGWDHFGGRAGRGLAPMGAGLGLALLLAGLALYAGEHQLLQAGSAYIGHHIVSDPIHPKPAAYYEGKLLRWLHAARAHLLLQGLFALGAAALLAQVRRRPARRWGLALALLLFADLCVNGRGSFSTIDRAYYRYVPPAVTVLQSLQDPAAPSKVLVWGRNEHLQQAMPEGRSAASFDGELRNADLPPGNLLLVHGLQQFNGYTPSVLKRAEALTGWTRDDRPGVDTDAQTQELLRRRRLWDLGAVRYLLSSRPLSAPGLSLVWKDSTWLYRNEQALPMAYLARQVQGGVGQAEAAQALTDPKDPRSRWAAPALLEAPDPAGNAGGRVDWLEQDDQHWRLRVQAQGGPGTLVLSRLYYPELWEARVDGAPVALEAVNASYCALRVPEGEHQIDVTFRDPGQPWCMLAFYAGLLLALAGILTAVLPRREAHA
jgi:hypothetical protein